MGFEIGTCQLQIDKWWYLCEQWYGLFVKADTWASWQYSIYQSIISLTEYLGFWYSLFLDLKVQILISLKFIL